MRLVLDQARHEDYAYPNLKLALAALGQPLEVRGRESCMRLDAGRARPGEGDRGQAEGVTAL